MRVVERDDSPLPEPLEQRAREALFRDLPGEVHDAYGRSDWDAYDKVIDSVVEQRIAAMFAEPNRRGIADLGTYRSRRRAADLLRERDRIVSCVVCGKDIPESPGRRRRSDARTCSPKCRLALFRSRDKVRTKRNGSAPALKGSMSPKRPSPIVAALLRSIDEVFAVPMPDGYPDEADWRRGQAHVLRRIYGDERASGMPDLMRFKRRCRSYINAQKRLSKET